MLLQELENRWEVLEQDLLTCLSTETSMIPAIVSGLETLTGSLLSANCLSVSINTSGVIEELQRKILKMGDVCMALSEEPNNMITAKYM